MSGALRWVVQPGDGARLDEVLAHIATRIQGDARGDARAPGLVAGAAEEGRAFVAGRRAGPDEPVQPGDEVVIYAARSERNERAGGGVTLLARAGGILVADKPAALPTTPDRRGDRSLLGEVARLLAEQDGWPIDPQAIHAASRLDVGVSGAVLCALGESAQRHVAAMRTEGRIHRVYAAIVGGVIEGEGVWDAAIGRAGGGAGRGRARPVPGGRDAEAASTRFRAVAWARGARSPGRGGSRGDATKSTLVRCEPLTGRMHQIRVHAAAAGAPVLGDREHGGVRALTDPSGRVVAIDRIALHALSVELPGEDGELLRVSSSPPDELRALWKALDGPSAAWDALAPPAVR